MLKLVLSTILMTMFLTGCGQKKFSTENIEMRKAGDSVITPLNEDDKATPGIPDVDHDNMIPPRATDEEVRTLEARLREAQERLATATQREETLREESEAAQAIARQEGRIAGLEESEEEATGLQGLVENTQAEAAEAEADAIAAEAEVKALEAELASVRASRAELAGKLEAAETALAESTRELEEVRSQIAENELLIAELAQSDNLLTAETQARIDALQEANSILRTRLRTVEERVSTDTRSVEEAESNETEDQSDTVVIEEATDTVTPADEDENEEPDVNVDSLPEVTEPDQEETETETIQTNTADQYQIHGSLGFTPSSPELSELTDSTAEDNQLAPSLDEIEIQGLFTDIPENQKREIILMFSAIPGSLDDVVNTLPHAGSENPLTHLRSLPVFTADCGDGELSDFSGWLNFSLDPDQRAEPCTYKAIKKNGDGEYSLVRIPQPDTSEFRSFVIEDLVETVKPSGVGFYTVLEKEDMENFAPLDPKFSRYASFIRLVQKVQSTTELENGDIVGSMKFDDSLCRIIVFSKTLNDDDLSEYNSTRCALRVQRIEE